MPTAIAQRIEVRLDTRLESVDRAESIARRTAEAAGFRECDVHKIGMAVREGVINAYNYGNQQDPRKKILMAIELEPEKMVVHVADEGRGFEVTGIPDPLKDENLLRSSGRGIFLMRTFMDEFDVRRAPGGGAELIMAKRLSSARNRPGPQRATQPRGLVHRLRGAKRRRRGASGRADHS